MEEAARARILELRREIAQHDELYFRKAAPVISDFEYDRLKAELRGLEARFPTPGEGVGEATAGLGDDRTGVFATQAHRVPMLSLDKAYSDEELKAFHARVAARLGREDLVYRIEPKYDGLAVSLTFEQGRLVRAVTRGNGAEGDDITTNARTLRALPETLRAGPWPEVIEVRGEIYLSLAEFARINEEREAAGEAGFANPRNLAVGSIRLQDAREVAERRLELVCYGWGAWEPAAGRSETLSGFREQLNAWGLPVPVEARVVTGAVALCAAVEEVRRVATANGFPADGVVVKLERVADQEALGVGPSAPRWAVARKFAPERVSTRLLRITLQVGRTGVVTPVAELAPVELAGSTVARATLHNADEIARRDLRIGDWVYVEKAGEIIPAIVGVDATRRTGEAQPYVFPDTCPACAVVLVREEGRAGHRCGNAACPAQVARRIAHFASPAGLDIGGLGPALIDALVARGLLRTPADLYGLRREDLQHVPGLGARSAEKLIASIEASRGRAEQKGARLLYGLGLPGVGKETAGRLAAVFGSLDALAATDEAVLRRPESEGGADLGEAAAALLVAHLRAPATKTEWSALTEAGIGDWAKAAANLPAAGMSGPLAGQTVVVTGTLGRWTRAEVAEKLSAAGARVGTDVTRQTTLVVAGAEPGSTLARARKRGVEVIDEVELARRLGEP